MKRSGKRKNPGSDKPNIDGPIAQMLKRVRTMEAKRKAENEADEQDPIKKQCQGLLPVVTVF